MSEGTELVLALCHEIGNLMGAIRLHAHLLDDDMRPRDLAMLSVDLDDLSARSSALLAHMRPLLLPGPRALDDVKPEALLSGLQELMEDHGGRGAVLAFSADDSLPTLRTDQEVIHHLLLSLLYVTLETTSSTGSVSLRAEAREDGVAFVLEDDGDVDEDPTLWRDQMKRGRPLVCSVASEILRRRGGRLEVERSAGITRIALLLPAD
jgi:nitrogen-specific signal transduction histidine kinase